jgi:hypothetical protein
MFALAVPTMVIADAVPPIETTDSMHARYYSPNLGRFVSVDPVGGVVGSSQSWNRYSYVNNNPIVLIDPTGMMDDRPNTMTGNAFGKKPLMQPAQTPEGERMDALFIGFFVSAGGGLVTLPYTMTSVTAALVFGGTWNLAGGATTRHLDGDPETGAWDFASSGADVLVGVTFGGAGYAASLIKFPGGPVVNLIARPLSNAGSGVLPIYVQKLIDQASEDLVSSGVLDGLANFWDGIQYPRERDPRINCPDCHSINSYYPSGPPRWVEYIASDHG